MLIVSRPKYQKRECIWDDIGGLRTVTTLLLVLPQKECEASIVWITNILVCFKFNSDSCVYHSILMLQLKIYDIKISLLLCWL